ncbi:site-specific DNA-methyltransferase [Crocosphaera sp. XPORK-15E]|uniref:DNA-methyltransferase n=1 Tax=Crocosphaera sp. XPORK-15E TaxID=3110247 RepID=UPI002B218EA4|nr:site-specific DNA-methyltransferase [Crocosphaera sp. XPORK-15E]MEA5535198.1 site-specific DNA-methyltransferase [Crocosphaera sp. XPORK-15E]
MPRKNQAPINHQLSIFEPRIKGELFELKQQNTAFELLYQKETGKLFQGNSIQWLKSLEKESIDLIVADPPYNIKKADWDKFETQEQYIEWSMEWIKEASRILTKTGTLYVCGFTEILADLKHPAMKYFKRCKWLIWYYKNKANLGKDWGRSHESILHLRKGNDFTFNIDTVRIPYGKHTLKYPSHPQAITSQYGNNSKNHNDWTPHPQGAKPKDVLEIPTTCNGMKEKTPHPTQKPEELLRRLILASSNENDLILDPFSGSGTTLVVAEQLNRKWLGCDICNEYNQWAIKRLENIIYKSQEEWIAFDRENQERRTSIR